MTRWLVIAGLCAACACGGTPPPTIAQHAAGPGTPDGDRDGDEIADSKDACPDKPEDFDLHEDTDGCPDLDDDHDGVPDEKDLCFDTPGTADGGCPDGCYFVTSTDDCFIITAIWSARESRLDAAVAALKRFPEIREISLQTRQRSDQPADTARKRLAYVKHELVTRGVPPAMLVFKELPADDPSGAISTDVFALISKQRFADGRFRETLCADPFDAVYRPAREHNYSCHPVVCGDGICFGDERDTCAADCGHP